MKLGVCVPYRNREAHLKEFVPKVGAYLLSESLSLIVFFICLTLVVILLPMPETGRFLCDTPAYEQMRHVARADSATH